MKFAAALGARRWARPVSYVRTGSPSPPSEDVTPLVPKFSATKVTLRANRDEGANRRVGKDDFRRGVGHLHAAQALGVAVGRSKEAVQGVTTVEVGDPGNSRVVVVGAVGIGPRHGPTDKSRKDGIGAGRRGRDRDAGVDERTKLDVARDVEGERFGTGFADFDVVVRRRVHAVGGNGTQ